MKHFILSAGLLITAAILYSAAYLTSAIISVGTNMVGESIMTSQAQPLLVISVIALILAILFSILGVLKKDYLQK